MIVHRISDIKSPPLFYKLLQFIVDLDVFLKLEGLNIAGSIKLKPAKFMIEHLASEGKLHANRSTVICSSSGNFAIALSIVCKERNYPLVCVIDPNISPISEKLLKLQGARLMKVEQRDENGGYLASRHRLIAQLLNDNPDFVLLDQHHCDLNSLAHSSLTAKEIVAEFPQVDYLFIGAGTTGTLMGCAKYFKSQFPKTKIIAIDSIGSVTFGTPASRRYIPGLGTSSRPGIVDENYLDDIVMVAEKDTITMCHNVLNRYGLMLGGSSATVLQGIVQYHSNITPHSSIVAISPDFGDRYLNTVYDKSWVSSRFAMEEAP